MRSSVLFGFVLFPAITLSLVYHPILAKMSVGLVSPYAKADVTKRLFAATVDGTLVATTLALYRVSESLPYLFVGLAYLLLRDAMAGRSIGKFVCGLVVVNLLTGRPCGWGATMNRNALLLLPGANVVAVFLEAATIVRDPQGQRLGDRFATTQVVEGFGAKDVVPAVQEWWIDFIAQLDGNRRKPGRVPAKVPRQSESAFRLGRIGTLRQPVHQEEDADCKKQGERADEQAEVQMKIACNQIKASHMPKWKS